MEGTTNLQTLQLYTLRRSRFILVFVTFFGALLITFLIGVSGPAITASSVAKATKRLYGGNPKNAWEFSLHSPMFSAFHQQVWLLCRVQLQQAPPVPLSVKLNVSVGLVGSTSEGSRELLQRDTAQPRGRSLLCSQEMCEDVVILHLGSVAYTRYKVSVLIGGLGAVSMEPSGVHFMFKTYNPTFTMLEIWFRFVFILCTFIVMCVYWWKMLSIPMALWTVEQSWLMALLPLLLLYNDPAFPLSLLLRHWSAAVVDVAFQTSFLSALLLFWLCSAHCLLLEPPRHRLPFYLPKVLIIGPLWALALTLGIWKIVNEGHDPSYHSQVDAGVFLVMRIAFCFLGALYIVYLLAMVAAAWRRRQRPAPKDEMTIVQVLIPNLRLKFLAALTFIELIISLTILFLRFGTHVLQNNFVAELSTHYQNSAEFLTFFGVLNYYIYTLAFVYCPSKFTNREWTASGDSVPMLQRVYQLQGQMKHHESQPFMHLTSSDSEEEV
uniref:transmembrane protein 181-like isoform X2 n=1 Tax=Myxine glutinosa TaxID=7769 RepID=UPI00358DDE59